MARLLPNKVFSFHGLQGPKLLTKLQVGLSNLRFD